MGHHRHHPVFVLEHVVSTMAAVVVSIAFATAGGGVCPPWVRHVLGCPVSAKAMVVDPRTSTDVFNYLRGLAHPWDSAFPEMPKLAMISVSDSGRVIVHFLHN